ncbi:MAG TPA: metallophosphoesterase [Verrucomicrobiae bacterium]|nr:metallophosphoesterase [Verrucomicrobiae bacterium]
MRTKLYNAIAAFTFSVAIGVTQPLAQAGDDRGHDDRDQVILSFSTVGDSRQDPDTPDPPTTPLSGQDAIWLQNTKAWSRIIDSIDAQHSHLLFFNGDMIMGYGNATNPPDNQIASVVNSDLMKFYRQYGFWRGVVAGLMEKGTYVVPVPGNHETQWKRGGKIALEVNENAWRANMSDLILDDARFQNLFGEQPSNENVGNNGASDGLTTDQSKLSYSFDFHGSHFVVINTDPAGNDAHAPVNWLAADLAAAQARGFQHRFVFGHKPAYTYYYGAVIPAPPATPLPGKPSGLDNFPAARDDFWDVIEQYGATYFCGHEHVFDMMQPRAALGGKAWQILVGSGGSPFEAAPTDATINPNTDRAYAWATVNIYQSGKVKITAYGFDDHFGPTHVIQTVGIH